VTPYHHGWVYCRTHTWISPLLVKAFAFLAVTRSEPLMKIATFNVNNLNKRLVNLLDWLRASRAGRGLPSGIEGDRFAISHHGN
jgi:hypothetical protein